MQKIYRLTRLLVSFSIVLLLTQMIAVSAQSTSSVTILRASYDSQNNLVIQVDLERGLSLTSASLISSGILYDLTIEPQALATELWVLLDASGTMVNAYAAVADEVRRLAQTSLDNQAIGGIIYDTSLQILTPTSRMSQLDTWLDEYIAQPNTSSCILDALTDLADIEQSARSVRRIVVFAGDTQANSSCDAEIPFVGAPINMIIIGNRTNALYNQIIAQSEGTQVQTAILGLEARVTDLQNSWQTSLIGLTLALTEPLESAEVRLTLSNGEVFIQTVQIQGEFIINTATPSPTQTATDNASSGVVVATIPATQIDEPTPEPTEQVIVSNPTTIPETDILANEPMISNTTLIFAGGIAAALVVVIVVLVLLGVGRSRYSPHEGDTVYDTELFSYDDEAEFDRTEIVTVRELMSHTGQTLVGKLTDERSGEIYEIHRPVSTLGRKANNDILIDGHTQISREHIRFTTRDDETVWLTRLTQNPVLVNERLIQTTRELSDGDILQLSPSLRLKYEYVEQEDQES